MRLPTGVTDEYLYFVAVDSTDYVTRKTGLSSFTVYRSRNGGAATAYTTPTITEVSSANMPGVYKFLIDEDMTIDSGDDSQEVCLHITATGMAPVTRVFELYRPKATAGETLTVASGLGASDVTNWKGSAAPAMTGDAYARLGAPAGASVSADVAAVKVDTAAIKAKTDSLTFTVANQVDVNVVDWKGSAAPAMTGDAFARLGAPAGLSVSADIAAVNAKTTNLPSDPADESLIIAATDAITALIGTPAGVSVSADIAAVKADTANIYSKVDTEVAAIKAVTDLLPDAGALTSLATAASIAALNNLSAAQVNAEVVDALNVDTYAEPGQGAPPATASLAAKLNYLFKAWRNKKTQTGSTFSLYADDATTVDQKATVSDDGTTFTSSEIASGP